MLTFKAVLQQIKLLRCDTNFWLVKITRKSQYTRKLSHLLLKKFALGRWTAQHVKILLQKGELLSNFCNNVLQPATTWFVVRHIWIWVVKRTTTLFNLFHVFVTRCTGGVPTFTLNRSDNHESREVMGIIWFFRRTRITFYFMPYPWGLSSVHCCTLCPFSVQPGRGKS